MRTWLVFALPIFVAGSLAVGCGDDSDDDAPGGGAGGDDSTEGSGGNASSGGSGSGGTGQGGDSGGDPPGWQPENPIPPGTDDPTDADCNLSGLWMVRATTVSEVDSAFVNSDQVAKRWFLYEIAQDGNDFQLSTALNCQVHVRSTSCPNGGDCSDVTLSDGGIQSILDHNSHAGLQGTFGKDSDECSLTMTPLYEVRGVNPETYLPSDPTAGERLADLPTLPTDGDHADVSDWDGGGEPGLQWTVDSVISGWRSSAQRDVQTTYSVAGDADYAIAPSSTEFMTKLDIETEEVVYASSNALMETPSTPAADGHFLEWRRIGDSRADVGDIPSDDLAACKYLEEEWPYDE